MAERRLARCGVITTPAKCVSCDSSDAAALTSCCGRSAVKLAFEAMDLGLLERLHHHQAVDEEAVALRRRDAPGRRVRARDVAQLLEVGHHVADRRRRELEARLLRQHARADRLALDDVTLDQRSSAGVGRDDRACAPFYSAPRTPASPAPTVDRSSALAGTRCCALIGAMPAPATPPPSFAAWRSSAATRRPAIAEPLSRLAAFLAGRGHEVVIDADTARSTPIPGYPTAPRGNARPLPPTSRSSSAATARCCRSRGSSRRSTCR